MTEHFTAPEVRKLRDLLATVDLPPREHVEALRRLRESAVSDPQTLLDLDRLELRFLERQAERADVEGEFPGTVTVARYAAYDRQLRRMQVTEVARPAALFDLAELRAAFESQGRLEQAAAADEVLRKAVAAVEIGPKLRIEAMERFAAVITDEEDLDFGRQHALLTATGEVMQALFDRSQERRFRTMARRLRRLANDRELSRRLARVLTPRGVRVLETTSLLLLIFVLTLLSVELWMGLDPESVVARRILLVDATVCLFFIVEFFFKMYHAPARISWFLRNFATDLLPAIPAVLMVSSQFASVRAARFLRPIQAARPLLSAWRLLLFLIRGLDAVVSRFSPLINRNFIFFEGGTHRREEVRPDDPRSVVFRAIRREHVILDDLPAEQLIPVLIDRARALAERLDTRPLHFQGRVDLVAEGRDIAVEEAIDRLYNLRPEEVTLALGRADVMALDRVNRVINAPFVRSLPFIRPFRARSKGETPEERIVLFGQRIADQLERWRGRILLFADLHGIVTGPQILDKVATAMVNASKRPAVRLLMFGALFWIVRMFFKDAGVVGEFLKRFVATPLVVLGGVCGVVLVLGRWLKHLAGEAAESLKRTSEAQFINLLELVKARTQDTDLLFLAQRIFRFEMDAWEAALALGQQVEEASSTQADYEPGRDDGHPPDAVREDLSRVAFLYLHFLDGAILHETDVKTTEQLLANLSLENIRKHHLRFSRRDHKRVRKLSLDSGSVFSGPYLWFQFITESVALEVAKRITEYNRHCFTLEHRQHCTPEQLRDMDTWLTTRRARVEGRMLDKIDPPDAGIPYRTTEFNSMDFLAPQPRRDAQIERVFGSEVLDVLKLDRRNMIREIFGTRPLHRLPRSKRSINFYRFFQQRLSRGRVLLAPLLFLGVVWWLVRNGLHTVAYIVREVLSPESVLTFRRSGRAPFRVALRKIHRMKAPGLLEAMHMRASFDPAYCGAPPTWSFGMKMEEVSELDRDMDFLEMRERERVPMARIAADNRRRVEQLHDIVRTLDAFAEFDGEEETRRKLGERAVTIAFLTNREHMRSLFRAERWMNRELPRFEDPETRIRVPLWKRGVMFLRFLVQDHPVELLMRNQLAGRTLSKRGLRQFKAAWHADLEATRGMVAAWLSIPDGVRPRDHATSLALHFYRTQGEVSRELIALRAVQSLSVLDVRNYRELVFRLGDYEADGEDPAMAQALP